RLHALHRAGGIGGRDRARAAAGEGRSGRRHRSPTLDRGQTTFAAWQNKWFVPGLSCICLGEENQAHFLDAGVLLERELDGGARDARGFLLRITVGAGRDRGKRDRGEAVSRGK